MAQLKHALIDVDFYDKPKIKALAYKFGNDGCFYLHRLILLISRATDAKITKDAALGLAYELRIDDKAESILDYCIDNNIIQVDSSSNITNQRVSDDQVQLEIKREQSRNRMQQMRNKCVTKNEQERNFDTVPVTDIDNNKNSQPEISQAASPAVETQKPKLETQKPTPPPDGAALPNEYDKIILKWCDYQEDKFRKKLGFMEIDAISMTASRMKLTPKMLENLINLSISNGWKGIQWGHTFAKEPEKQDTKPIRKYKTVKELNLEVPENEKVSSEKVKELLSKTSFRTMPKVEAIK